MKFIDEKTIKLDRELSDLDKLVLKFLRVLEKHTEYAIVSGYVAILLGRSRTTEDVDLFIPMIAQEKFGQLYQELMDKGFWSVVVDAEEELYAMLSDGLGIRFAERGKVIPNFEVKFVKDELDRLSLGNKIKVITKGGEIIISGIGLQVAYKKLVLGSRKDLEDARYLQKLFNIKDEKINKYKVILERYGRI